MGFFVPKEEQLERPALEQLQRHKLATVLTAARGGTFYGRKLDRVNFDPAGDPIARLPFTTRHEIQQDQDAHPPYGSRLTRPMHEYMRLHQTSGSRGVPLRMLDTASDWRWWHHCWGIIYRAAGVTGDDRFLFPFSFGPFIGFWAAFDAANALGNLCLAAGGMSTVGRLAYLLDHRATVVCCTPTYALHMAEVAKRQGIDLADGPVRTLIVAGEPGGSIPSTRRRIESAWGARVFDHAGMTEIGPWGFECVEAPGTMHVMENEFIAEVIDPESGAPVAENAAGELVLTNLGRMGNPLIRYRTGDRIRLTRERCACGRWFACAVDGILGRLDDMLIVRGNNVFPAAVEECLRAFDEIAEFRLVAQCRGVMNDLLIEVEPAHGAVVLNLAGRVAAAVRDRLHFAPTVVLVEAGSLPRFELKARRVVHRNADDGAVEH